MTRAEAQAGVRVACLRAGVSQLWEGGVEVLVSERKWARVGSERLAKQREPWAVSEEERGRTMAGRRKEPQWGTACLEGAAALVFPA